MDSETYPSSDWESVRADFNEIAELEEPKWNHNNAYSPLLLRQIPPGAKDALDIGCGKGALTARLAEKVKKVVAVDIAEKMIEYALAENRRENIEYIPGNILEMDFPPASFDVIVSTATAHHLPFEWLLEFAKDKLRPGGRLLLVDLAKPASFSDYLVWSLAFFPNVLMNLLKNGRLKQDDRRSAEAWRRHGQRDAYMTIPEIRRLAARHLPGSTVRRLLFWRYLLVWEKPPAE